MNCNKQCAPYLTAFLTTVAVVSSMIAWDSYIKPVYSPDYVVIEVQDDDKGLPSAAPSPRTDPQGQALPSHLNGEPSPIPQGAPSQALIAPVGSDEL